MSASSAVTVISRRAFMGTGAAAGAGLVLGVWIPGCSEEGRGEGEAGRASFAPNVWLSIDAAGTVTIRMARCEIGQGVMTVLPMIVAEELGADWTRVTVEQADADQERYGDQGAGGSRSVRTSWEPLRQAGAAAREMLILAAAGKWGVPPAECDASAGAVTHATSGKSAPFGELVQDASGMEVPGSPPLRDPSEFRILGRPVLRVDAPAKVRGESIFGFDVRLPEMLTAVLARPPVIGGRLRSFDGTAAEARPGVRRVLRVGEAVAVVADHTWAAMKGRDALKIEWDDGPNAALSSDAIEGQLRRGDGADGARAREEGDVRAAFRVASTVVEAAYDLPFLAHAPMEPPNCTARVTRQGCEVWAPTQSPVRAREAAAKAAGLPIEKVTLHITLSGGGFGRRLMQDYVTEAVLVAKEMNAPVKVVFTREDDMRHGIYRPPSRHLLKAGLDAEGRVMAWTHRVIAPSIGRQLGRVPEGTLDEGAVSGAANMPYAIPNVWIDYVMSTTPVPLGWLRAVYDAQTAFANECFIDEIAHAKGEDPVALRRELLRGSPRHQGVLDLAAEKAGWGDPPPSGRHRGVAVHFCFGSWAASVVEVSVPSGGTPRVHRVVSAIDCGMALNPLGVEAQVQGGVVFALSAALKGEITIGGGRILQGSFDDYPILTIDEMPVVETHIVASGEQPTGTGEPPVPPIAPALANAIFAATGSRLRRLPLRLKDAGSPRRG